MNDIKDVKTASMLRRAVRVGYLRVYPGLEDAWSDYAGFCLNEDRPCVVVLFREDSIAIHGRHPSLSEHETDQAADHLRTLHGSVESWGTAVRLHDVHPLKADELASELYRIMCAILRTKRESFARALYPQTASARPEEN